MLILLAITLIGIAIWLRRQLIGQETNIVWTPIAPSEGRTQGEQEVRRERRTYRTEEEAIAESLNDFRSDISEVLGPELTIAPPSRLKHPKYSAGPPQQKPKRERQYDGRLTLPEKVYEGTSKQVAVTISPGLWRRISGGARLMTVSADGTPRFEAVVPEGPADAQYFEVELLAAGITVEGDKRQRRKISNDVITFYWNCAFPTKGDYEVALTVRLRTGRRTIDLGEPITHRLKVVKYLGIPKQIVAVIVGISSLTGTIIGIVDGGHKLHWW